MTRRLAVGLALALTAAALIAPSSAAESTKGYIVVLKKSVDDAGSVSREHSDRYGFDVRFVYKSALKGYAAKMSRDQADRVAADSRVAWVEADRTFSIAAQTLPTGINRIDAELSPTANIDGVDDRVDVDVAIIDTGLDLDHPDLNVNTAGGRNCKSGVAPNDNNGHGSHVGGTVGALDNTIGVVGVAPGARLWPVKVLGRNGSGSTAEVVCGIDWVTANAAEIEIANMSLGGFGSDDNNCGRSNSDAMHRAICRSARAGVMYVVAAGNNHGNAANQVPAAYNEVMTVSALADFNGLPGGGAPATCTADIDDTFANFSNYGADIDIIAPGVCIFSTWMNGGYDTISGTSMASPHVAGAAALYQANNPGATPLQTGTALQNMGNLGWTWPSQDPDGVQEKLLNVAGL